MTGESVDYYVWGSGEPSVTDSDGTPEDYVLLWHTDSGWIYNDCRNDPAAAYPSVYGGKLAYAERGQNSAKNSLQCTEAFAIIYRHYARMGGSPALWPQGWAAGRRAPPEVITK